MSIAASYLDFKPDIWPIDHSPWACGDARCY
jgi:hypothetical protein